MAITKVTSSLTDLDGGITIDNITIDGTEIDLSSGDLSIDVAGNLQIDADDSGEVRFLDGGTQYATIKKDGNNALIQSIVADGDLVFQGIDGSSFVTAMQIDMSEGGRVGIGTTTPDRLFHVKGTSTSTVAKFANTGNVVYIELNAADQAGADAGYIKYNNTKDMSFWTDDTERVSINSSGKLLVGSTSDSFDNNSKIVLHAGSDSYFISSGQLLSLNRTGSHGAMIGFYYQGSFVGSISSNSNSLPSDKNFKRDISDLDLGLNLITKLKPSQYNYKIDSEDCPKMYGLIAQDLEESLTEVGVEKNSSWLLQHKPNDNEKGSEYEVDYLKLTPVLINAIKEQQEQIEALQSEINTLKGL